MTRSLLPLARALAIAASWLWLRTLELTMARDIGGAMNLESELEDEEDESESD